jgi:hypothetical protein
MFGSVCPISVQYPGMDTCGYRWTRHRDRGSVATSNRVHPWHTNPAIPSVSQLNRRGMRPPAARRTTMRVRIVTQDGRLVGLRRNTSLRIQRRRPNHLGGASLLHQPSRRPEDELGQAALPRCKVPSWIHLVAPGQRFFSGASGPVRKCARPCCTATARRCR